MMSGYPTRVENKRVIYFAAPENLGKRGSYSPIVRMDRHRALGSTWAVFHGPIGRTAVMKYSVSPKQLPGTPLCCSYDNATRCPLTFSIFSATASSRTLNVKICGAVPGHVLIANSPSHVLHNQPFFEIFWT